MSLKEKIINEIIEVEGGYVNDPSDSGGETNYGITIKEARRNGYFGEMRDLPRSLAFSIYEKKYWTAVKANELSELSEAIAHEVVDSGVNMGQKRAVRILQDSLNALNNRQKLYADLIVDGNIGRKTLEAYAAYFEIRKDEETLLKILNCLQGAFLRRANPAAGKRRKISIRLGKK